MAIDRQTFRKVLGSFAAGVTIITTVGDDGKPYGLTATAFSSVSLDPPLVLVCVDKKSESYPHLLSARRFSVSFLADGHEELSNRFARSGGDKFGGLEVEVAHTDVPRPLGVLAYVDCVTTDVVDAGDHSIFLGRVEAGDACEGEPLVYFRGGYRRLTGI